jgi:hypothetical protein
VTPQVEYPEAKREPAPADSWLKRLLRTP